MRVVEGLPAAVEHHARAGGQADPHGARQPGARGLLLDSSSESIWPSRDVAAGLERHVAAGLELQAVQAGLEAEGRPSTELASGSTAASSASRIPRYSSSAARTSVMGPSAGEAARPGPRPGA